MSKGNINYKYLRRRKNWFQRNWKALIIYIVLILAVLGAGAFVCIRFTPLGSKLGITRVMKVKKIRLHRVRIIMHRVTAAIRITVNSRPKK